MSKHDHKYFYEDEVWRIHKGNLKIGMVVETSEFTSSDDSSDDEDQVKPGDVRVAWYPAGLEEVLSEKKLHLADRSLMPGDIVRRMTDKGRAQKGICKNVHVFSNVEVIGTKQVIFGVKSADLRPLETFYVDILICLEGWVGIVKDVSAKLTLRFSDGSKVLIDDNLASDLEDVFNRRDHDSEFMRYDYYPGQILFGPIRTVDCGEWKDCSAELTTARTNKPYKGFKMTVEDVDFQRITVRWLCRANFSSEDKLEQPGHKVTGPDLEKVRMLNIFESCTLQIGDRNSYVIKDSDLLLSRTDWKKLQLELLTKQGSIQSAAAKQNTPKVIAEPTGDLDKKEDEGSSEYEDCEDCLEKDTDSNMSEQPHLETKKKKKNHAPVLSTRGVKKKKLKMSRTQRDASSSFLVVKSGMKVVTEALSTRSEIDVVWQDGKVESGVGSTDLYPIQHLDEHEFFPGDFVVESKDGFHPHTYGVVQEVDYMGRFCEVKWFKTYTEGTQPEPIFIESSQSSVYDLKDHPDFKYRPGAIVIRIANWKGDNCGLGAGQVLDTEPSGLVRVWWAGADNVGLTSTCWPQDIYKVGEYDSDEGELWAEDEDEKESGTDDSWSTESEHEVDEEEEVVVHDEAAELKTKLITYVEKAGVTMRGLEELVKDNHYLESPSFYKKLIAISTRCKHLDRLLGTDFFSEAKFRELLEKIKDKDKISTVERAVQSQVLRLFSTGEDESQELQADAVTSPSKDSGIEPGGGSPSPAKPNSEDLGVGYQLCKILKPLLVKIHEEIVKKYGEQEVQAFKEKYATEPYEDFDDSIASELSILGFLPLDTPMFQMFTSDRATVPEIFSPVTETLPVESIAPLSPGSFQMVDTVPDYHKFKLTVFQLSNMKTFVRSVKREIVLLQSSLPFGITVKGFDERMDLFSAMIEGPKNTPYEDGLFFFDFQLGPAYPSVPPTCHYISYCSDKLNPNLYEDGKVCVSLLGTWNGKGTETWTPNSNLLQLLVSIQGLILVREPYYNEAGYERQKGTQEGSENSRTYNEMAVLKLVHSMTRLLLNLPETFADEIKTYCQAHAPRLIERLENWLSVSLNPPPSSSALPDKFQLPDFPLLPASRGFCISLQKALGAYKIALHDTGLKSSPVENTIVNANAVDDTTDKKTE